MLPDAALIAADCGRQPCADQAALDLLLALLRPDDEQMALFQGVGESGQGPACPPAASVPGASRCVPSSSDQAWYIRPRRVRRIISSLPGAYSTSDGSLVSSQRPPYSMMTSSSPSLVLLPGLAFVIAVDDIAGGEVGVIEMRAGRNEDPIDISAGKGRALLVESALADAEVDGQDECGPTACGSSCR